MQPTAEQQQAIDAVATGDTVVIEAGAGTGKTTTLAMAARAGNRTGTYLAFNKAIAADAGRALPMGVEARTVHSVAYRWMRQEYPQGDQLLDRLRAPRLAPWKEAKALDLGLLRVTLSAGVTKVLQPTWQAGHVRRAMAAFLGSADPEPTWRHFPWVDGIDLPAADGSRTRFNNRSLAMELEPALRKAWDDLRSPTGKLRWPHDTYVKLAQLAGARIPGRLLLFDEAQDASPVMLAWLRQAQEEGAQVVYVGDSQQQIYDWRGAINALSLVDAAHRTFLTQSWRFGQGVADVANVLLELLDAELRLVGAPGVTSRVWTDAGHSGHPDALLCRTNAGAVEAVLTLQELGLQPHLVGGADDLVRFAHAAGKLQAGEKVSHPELACFESWREVRDYVEQDPGGDDLRAMVNLIEEYGVQVVCDALDGCIGEAGADVVVSTAHKAKGREWPVVALSPDFGRTISPDRPPTASELRLLYVACTRARQSLNVTACQPVRDLLEDAAA